jgi:coenzyme PQQ precursor peptide PqqA
MEEARRVLAKAPNSIYSGDTRTRFYHKGDHPMAWTTPTLVEICVGLEINGYLPAEF